LSRPLSEIARDVYRDWKPVNFAAAPYLSAMSCLNRITDDYGADSAVMVVSYFLGNATSWKGDVARAVKAELRATLASARGSRS